MRHLVIDHRTHYRYAQPVVFGPHRLMVRPRDSHDMRVIQAGLTVSPPASMRWLHDVFGNSIAIAEFSDPASDLILESRVEIDHFGFEDYEFPVAPHAAFYPFAYTDEERLDLGRTLHRHYPDEEGRLIGWAKRFLDPQGGRPTRDLLIDMTKSIKAEFGYSRREAPGTQTPLETLDLGSGSCRDFALLMMEALRALGFAARFVSGYLYDPAVDGGEGNVVVGAGATHAWTQVFLPGAGWVEFDPTNGIVGGENLIRVAVAREPSQAVPVDGSFTGTPGDYLGMEVTVTVTETDNPPG